MFSATTILPQGFQSALDGGRRGARGPSLGSGDYQKKIKIHKNSGLFKEPGESAGNPAGIKGDDCGKSLNNFSLIASVVHNSSRNKTIKTKDK